MAVLDCTSAVTPMPERAAVVAVADAVRQHCLSMAPNTTEGCRCAQMGTQTSSAMAQRFNKCFVAKHLMIRWSRCYRLLHPQQLVQDQAGRADAMPASANAEPGSASRPSGSQKVHHVAVQQAVHHVMAPPGCRPAQGKTAAARRASAVSTG